MECFGVRVHDWETAYKSIGYEKLSDLETLLSPFGMFGGVRVREWS